MGSVATVDEHLPISAPGVNQPMAHGVPVPMGALSVDSTQTAGAAPARARKRRQMGFGRSMAVSLSLHALLVLAGISGGVAYQRGAGAEVAGEDEEMYSTTTILLAADQRPAPVSSLSAPSAEPDRAIDDSALTSESDAEPGPMPGLNASASDFAAELPMTASTELAAGGASSGSAGDSGALERAIGDPRTSWKLAGLGTAGLQLGLGSAPPISDCCGEPQPGPAKALAADVYIYPEVLKMARAEFPVKSQRRGEQGSVLLEMDVGADGLVKGVRVIESSGHARIDDCAAAAAWDWVFRPAKRNGVAEAAIARHRYTFRLTGSGG